MNKPALLFCKVVLLLEWIPRYGRLYSFDPSWYEEDADVTKTSATVRWRWMRRGCWGINLLSKLNLLWPYIDHYERLQPTDVWKDWYKVPDLCCEDDSHGGGCPCYQWEEE